MSTPSLLAVFAHPDDETFRAGGMLTMLAHRGVRVQIVTATRGEAGFSGETDSPNPGELATIRENELRCACHVLKIEPPIILDYADGYLSMCDSGDLCFDLLFIIEKFQPQVMLSFGPDGLSGHLDHIVIGRSVDKVCLKHQKSVALYHMAVPFSIKQSLGMDKIIQVPDEQISLSLDVNAVWDIKMKAVHCHASQLSSSPILSQSLERQRIFLGTEHYVRFNTWQTEGDFIPSLLKEYIR